MEVRGFALDIPAQLDLRLAKLQISKNVLNWTKPSSSSAMDKKTYATSPPP